MSVVNNAQLLWEQTKEQLESQVSEAVFISTFNETVGLYLDENCLTISVPNTIVSERIERRFRDLILETLADLGFRDVALELRVVESEPTEGADLGLDELLAEAIQTSHDSSTLEDFVQDDLASRPTQNLNARYTFDSFVIGSSNRFAHAAALSVAERPARSYNPLFIYGSPGLGKTHLLQAIAHYVEANYPDHKVRYISTETMLNEFIDSIRNNTQPEFKSRYRETDVLLVDDVQFMEGKEQLQEEFFYTFNTLHEANRQIILSSDRPPDALATLQDRLRSRFKMGLVTDIQPPDFETRLAILRRKAEQGSTPIPDDVLKFIVTHITNNIRELEGALNRVTAWAILNKATLTLDEAQNTLADIAHSTERQITPELILNTTADMFGFTVQDLKAQDRRRPLVHARQICMYAFRELTDLSYPEIAKIFGGRDHTTIIYGCDKIKDLMGERRAVLDDVTTLIQRIKNE